MSRNVKILVLVSLALNLILGGLVIGHAVQRGMGHHRGWGQSPEEFARHFPKERRDLVLSTFAKACDSGTKQRDFRKLRQDAIDALSAEPYNAKAYLRAAGHMQNMLSAQRERTSKAIATLANQLTADERKQLAKAMRRPPRCNQESRPADEQSRTKTRQGSSVSRTETK